MCDLTRVGSAFPCSQRWKGEYKRLSYGSKGMAKLHGRRLFKLSRFGVFPFDAEYDDVRGVNLSALVEVIPHGSPMHAFPCGPHARVDPMPLWTPSNPNLS